MTTTFPHVDKKSLRARLLAQRDQLSQAEVELRSQKVVTHLLALDVWQRIKSVALYAPIRNEVQLIGVGKEKEIYYPRVTGEVLEFYRVTSEKDLKPGRFNIPEPSGESEAKASLQKVEVVIVPGVGFDREGYRLGYGQGFYDKTLTGHEKYAGVVIGVAYDFQVLDHIPRDSRFDEVRCDWVVSESQVYQTN